MNKALDKKVCPTCNDEKPISQFGLYGDGYPRRHCRSCANRPDRNKKYSKEKLKIVLMTGLKECQSCGEIKNLSDFGSNVSSKDGKSCYCKKCRISKETKKKMSNPEAYKEEKRKHYQKYKSGYRCRQLQRNFGITLEEYNKMFSTQKGQCKCCGVHQSELRLGLSVDHCHSTQKVRGLLCGNCNTSIGLAKDNPDILRNMVRYLEENS